MKPFSTLFAKIVFWSFLNLLIVAGVFAALFAVQFRGEQDAESAEAASVRVRGLVQSAIKRGRATEAQVRRLPPFLI